MCLFFADSYSKRLLTVSLCPLLGLWLLGSGAFNTHADQKAATSKVWEAPYAVTEKGANHRVWRRVMAQTNALGRITYRTNSFTELSSGLHHRVNGEWVLASEEIDLTARGAAATNAQHQVQFAANLNGTGSIELTTPSGEHLRSTVMGLSFFDTASGQNVILAELQDSIGQISANQVLYTNALVDSQSGFFADVLYTHKRANFEQDILLRRQPPAPAEFGLNPHTTRLQVWTEFFGAPEPSVTSYSVSAQVPGQSRQFLADQALNFGSMHIGLGTASAIGGTTTNTPNAATNGTILIPVAKQWVHRDGRTFLIEEVPFDAIAPKLSALPSGSAATNSPSRTGGGSRQSFFSRPLPVNKEQAKGPPMRVAQADIGAQPGFRLDYLIADESLTNFTFQSDTTYLSSGRVDFYGTTTIEGGAVIKCAPAGEGNNVHGTLVCQTSPYRPAIFTCTNDDSVGTQIPGSTGVPTIEIGTQLYWYDGGPISNLRFCYAWNGYGGDGTNVDVSDCQFVKCNQPITVTSGATILGIHNVLITMDDSFNNTANNPWGAPPTGLMTYSPVLACLIEHLTADLGSQNLMSYNVYVDDPSSNSFSVTNSIVFTPVFDPNYFWGGGPVGITPATNAVYQAASNPGTLFQSVGAANYYLATNSPTRGVGTTNLLAATLADIQQKTTQPPVDLATNYFHASTNLYPRAPRDTNALPDLGYHYDPLDYALQGASVSNITVQLLGGAAIGFYDTTIGYDPGGLVLHGLNIEDGGSFISTGSPKAMNHLVWYNLVQEQSNTNWVSPLFSESDLLVCNDLSGPPIQIQCRFTHFNILNGDGATFFLQSDGNDDGLGGIISFRDCEFGPAAYLLIMPGVNPYYPLTVGITNCLFERTLPYIQDTSHNIFTVSLRNNLFYGGSLTIYADSGPTNVFLLKDNFFCFAPVYAYSDDGLTFTNYITAGNNAYTTNLILLYSQLYVTNASDVVVTNLTFQAGPLGNYYQPTNSPLLNKGDLAANTLGMYGYTVLTNQIPEGTSTVSIGYHYVALNGSGNPFDANGNGIPDYVENWGGFLPPAGWLIQHFGAGYLTNSSAYSGADPDGDGLNNAQEYRYGTDPLVSQGFNIWVGNPAGFLGIP